MKEGVGKVAPPKVAIPIAGCTVRHFRRLADLREKARGYARGTEWARGLTTSPTLSGLVGEYAFTQWLRQAVGIRVNMDLADREHGDGGSDFTLYGQRVQIKCRRHDYGSLLVRRVTRGGIALPLRWDYCVQTTWTNSGREDQTVTLDGWVSCQWAIDFGQHCPAMQGNHTNLRVFNEDFSSPSDLADLVRGWRELHESRPQE